MVKEKKSERVWKYLIENQVATAKEVSAATGVSYGYVSQLMRKIGTPKEVRMLCGDINATSEAERSKILDTAKDLVTTDRAEQHGDAEANFTMIASYWNTHLGLIDFIKVDDVPIMLTLMKIARLHGDDTKNLDNYIDACGYMALGGEIAET
jgi:hypothetical protein